MSKSFCGLVFTVCRTVVLVVLCNILVYVAESQETYRLGMTFNVK